MTKSIPLNHTEALERQVTTFATCWWLGLNYRNPEIANIVRGGATKIVFKTGHALKVGDNVILKGVRGLLSPDGIPDREIDALSDLCDNPSQAAWSIYQVTA